MAVSDRAVVRVGLTLPSFQSEPEKVLAVARAAEDAGLDGVFLFDHLFRRRGDAAGAERRPALELLTMTAAVAQATERIAVGTLVARATLRPPAMLRAAFETLERIAPGRIIAGIGGGDDDSIAEDSAFGVLPGDPAPAGSGAADLDAGSYRLDRLEATVQALTGRSGGPGPASGSGTAGTDSAGRPASHGPGPGVVPVWVAGVSPGAVRIAAEQGDGWNRWGGGPESFAAAAERVRAEVVNAGRDPAAFTATWGGLAVLAPNAADVAAKVERLRGDRPGIVRGDPPEVADQIAAYGAAGAAWVILGPIDSSDPANATLLGEARRLLPAR